MKIWKLWPLMALMASPVAADGWNLRDGDRVLDPDAIALIADGGALTYFDDGISLFSAGGAYSYTYANNGGTAFGRFSVQSDGVICIEYRNTFSRCDKYVRNAGRLVLLTEDGERYPVKSEKGTLP